MTQPNGTNGGVLRPEGLVKSLSITKIENDGIDPLADNIASLETDRVCRIVTVESGCQVLSW